LPSRAHAARRHADGDALRAGAKIQRQRGDDVRHSQSLLPQRARRLLVRYRAWPDGARARRRAERLEHQHREPRRDRERRAVLLARGAARAREGRRDCSLQSRLDGDPAVSRKPRRMDGGASLGREARARARDRPRPRGAVSLVRGASPETLRRRAEMLARARAFFAERGVLEVETPALSPAAPSDPALESIAAEVASVGGTHYLPTSPEFAMKRLIADGLGDIYQVCRVLDRKSTRLNSSH